MIRLTAPLLLAAGSGGPATADAPSAAELKEQCRLAWTSLQTLHFTSNEYDRDGDRIDSRRGSNRFEFWQAPGGKRAMVTHAVYPDRTELVEDFRQDGRRRYSATAFEGHPDVIRHVSIQNQPDSEDRYDGTMNGVLWLLMPAGKPVHVHLEDGAEVVADEEAAGGGRVTLIGEHRGRPLRIVVDPARDWLPFEVSQGERFRVVATEFTQDNGRWFPVAGRMDKARGAGTQASGFEVIDFQINRAIPPRRFMMPEVEAGVAVIDQTGKMSRTEFKGGRESFEQRLNRYSSDRENRPLSDPIIVPRRGGSRALLFGLVLLGSASLLMAVGLRLRRSFKDD